jgi:hypothetical protein
MMDASEATDPQRSLPPPISAARPDDEGDDPAETAAVPERRPRRRALLIILAVWALVMAGEIGYVIGRDRASNTPAAARIVGNPGDFIVMQAVLRSVQDRLDAATTALAQSQPASPDAQTNPSATPVPVPLQSFDPLAGAPMLTYSGTLVLASCTGFSDPTACAAQSARLHPRPDGRGRPHTVVADVRCRTGRTSEWRLRCTRSGHNPAYALACPAETMATFFDAELAPNQLTVTNGVPVISSFSVTLTITAPANSTCAQQLQSVYQGTITPRLNAERSLLLHGRFRTHQQRSSKQQLLALAGPNGSAEPFSVRSRHVANIGWRTFTEGR